MEDYNTIAIFSFPNEYAVLRLLFDQKNIQYIFLHETMISVLPFHSNTIGGIRLQVHKNDIEQATKIMNQLNDSSDLKIV